MKPQEFEHLPVDWKFDFHLKDGRTVVKRGGCLLCVRDGHYAIDEKKCDLIESYDLHDDVHNGMDGGED